MLLARLALLWAVTVATTEYRRRRDTVDNGSIEGFDFRHPVLSVRPPRLAPEFPRLSLLNNEPVIRVEGAGPVPVNHFHAPVVPPSPSLPPLPLPTIAATVTKPTTAVSVTQSTSTTTVTQSTPAPTVSPAKMRLIDDPFPAKPSKSRAQRMKKGRDGVKLSSLQPDASPTHSYRLLNDLLVISPPQGSRLYALVLLAVHEASESEGLECGRVNLDGFVKLTAFINALQEANSSPLLKSLSLGAVVVDTCSSDLRTIADLYELLAGTNIQKTDLIAVIRDDDAFLPNVDAFIARLGLPVIHAYPAKSSPLSPATLMPSPADVLSPSLHSAATYPLVPISTATPLSGPLLLSLLHALHASNSTCFSVLFDASHKGLVPAIRAQTDALDLCVEERLQIDEDDMTAELAVRRLLLTEARAVLVLLDRPAWLQLLRALREELVIPGRFILLSPMSPSWLSSRAFRNAWPYFDQLLVASTREIDNSEVRLRQERLDLLARKMPEMPYPKSWIRHFWATAYECHVAGTDAAPGDQQFSRTCTSHSLVNFTDIAPSVDILPIERAVEAIANGLRRLVDSVCPSALITSITDCTNRPSPSLAAALHSLDFVHSLGGGDVIPFANITAFDARVRVSRAAFSEGELRLEQLALFDDGTRQLQTLQPLTMVERDGSQTPIHSFCPRCSCSSVRMSRRRTRPPPPPSLFSSALRSPSLFIFSLAAVMASLMCMIGIYQKLSSLEAFRVCGIFTYTGLTCLCAISPMFVLPSSVFSCSVKKSGLWICLSAIYAPMVIETVLISVRKCRPSSSLLFWLCVCSLTVLRIAMRESRALDYANDVVFVTNDDPNELGVWRCAPGDGFERELLLACLVPVLFMPIALVLSAFRAKGLAKLLGLATFHLCLFGIPASLILPSIDFESRDVVFAAGLLVFAVSLLILNMFRGKLGAASIEGSPLGLGTPHSEWDDDDERRFNDAVAAVVKECEGGGKEVQFNSCTMKGGHVFYISETGALTSQPLHQSPAAMTLKKIGPPEDLHPNFYPCGSGEKVHAVVRRPQPHPRSTRPYGDEPRSPHGRMEQRASFDFENERF